MTANSTAPRRLVLASSSPRRRQLIEDLGVRWPVAVLPPDIDDGVLRAGQVSPKQWVGAMAYMKARRVADQLQAQHFDSRDIVLGADTVCVAPHAPKVMGASAAEEHILGQPGSAEDARRMMQLLRNAAHETLTGVALMDLESGVHRLFVDAARVTIGPVSDEAIEAYVASGAWRGKAGGYNLAERIAAGWPMTYAGDPTTVMGLPVQRLRSVLAGWR